MNRLRTCTLVGLGSALFMLISKYGFFDVLGENVDLDRPAGHAGAVSVALEIHGPGPVAEAAELGEIDGVLGVAAGDVNEMFE